MKYLLIVLSVIITLKLSAKEVIIDFNDPANFYEGYLFSNGILVQLPIIVHLYL